MELANQDNSDSSLSGRLGILAGYLRTDAEKALIGAGEILDEIPGQQQALFLLVSALRLLDNADGARGLLELTADVHPKLASVQYELGLMLSGLGQRERAIEHFNRVVELEPNHAAAWRALGNLHSRTGDCAAAAEAYKRHAQLTLQEIKLLEDAAEAGNENLVKAEQMIHASLDVNPTDVSLVRILGRVYTMLGDYYWARRQFARVLELAPVSTIARINYVESLYQGMMWREATEQLDILLEADPDNAEYKSRKAHNLVMLGEVDRALALIDEARPQMESNPRFWLNLGHSLRTIGQSSEAVEAYRTCLKLDPQFGPAWLGLANLKTHRFSQADIEKMLAALDNNDLDETYRIHLEYAVGQALEHAKDYAGSFDHYRKANALRRSQVHYSPEDTADNVKKSKTFFRPEFFRARSGVGCPAPDPIFIVGMVRAGSTLVEQILSSHSMVEGTMELPDLGNVVSELIMQRPGESFPELLADLDGATWKALGEQYLEATRGRRTLGRPFFTDKSGTNLWRVGLLQLILPNAKIVDARRHPLGCCFSAFKQNFSGASTPHSYDQSELGGYYRDYVEMMAHFDKVLPGRVHRVYHEEMIRDPEMQIRRLLDYCGLPFEEQCLRFYETKRAVGTFSSEQVRKPISAGSSEQWRHYEPWLGPLKEALGEVLTRYPDVPEFD